MLPWTGYGSCALMGLISNASGVYSTEAVESYDREVAEDVGDIKEDEDVVVEEGFTQRCKGLLSGLENRVQAKRA